MNFKKRIPIALALILTLVGCDTMNTERFSNGKPKRAGRERFSILLHPSSNKNEKRVMIVDLIFYILILDLYFIDKNPSKSVIFKAFMPFRYITYIFCNNSYVAVGDLQIINLNSFNFRVIFFYHFNFF